MKFGKEIVSNQIPGWSPYYLDYKSLKKIIAAANKSIADTNSLLIEVMRPSDAFSPISESPIPPTSWSGSTVAPLSIPVTGKDEDRGPEFQRSKAMFFFKLERELEKINAFYLQKEAELKLRLENLLAKRQAATQRLRPNDDASPAVAGAEWRAVEEGFRSLEKDLSKLQQFIEINATGFRKILKKWDKRSKSRTKELYLARQVEVQPCFNRQLIAELSDTVAACLLHPTDDELPIFSNAPSNDDIFLQQMDLEGAFYRQTAFLDFEANMIKAISLNDHTAIEELLSLAEPMASHEYGRRHIMRILWKAAILANASLADVIISSSAFDLGFVDDINERTSLHEAAIAGELRLVSICLQQGIEVNRLDQYGRSALHYASMNGHAHVTHALIAARAIVDILDKDNYTPLIYAVVSGVAACVHELVDAGALVQSSSASSPTPSDLIPLSLACQHGHLEVATLLLEHGALRLANSKGEFPIHIAAREGHVEVCRLLVAHDPLAKDIPDKYNEWTPLFHAARNGHEACVGVLLEAGVNPHVPDEYRHTAVYYAIWYGHIACANRLLQAMSFSGSARTHIPQSPFTFVSQTSSTSPQSDLEVSPLNVGSDFDLDAIPSLSLPPPIMPFRIYGHNYLDKTHLVQITLGNPFNASAKMSPIQLLPGVPGQHTHSTIASPSIKVVMTSKPSLARNVRIGIGGIDTQGSVGGVPSNISSVPASQSYSIVVPLPNPYETFAFQLQSLEDLTIELSFYPTFGSKPIGRAIVTPHAFRESNTGGGPMIFPIINQRLHTIGLVALDAFVITPFSEVALEIGGAVETYWKSASAPSIDFFTGVSNTLGPLQRAPPPLTPLGVATSPSPTRSPPEPFGASSVVSSATTVTNSITHSSLSGEFVHVVVQVTRDLIPVVFTEWNLPVEGFDVGVADVTAQQFEQLAENLGRGTAAGQMTNPPKTVSEWHQFVSERLCTLTTFLQLLPITYGVILELRYPNPVIIPRYHLGHTHEANVFVDSVLKTVYSVSRSLPLTSQRRKIIFSSFVPSVCIALNWKQPNYAVFFASKCGVSKSSSLPSNTSPTLVSDEEESDNRCRSVSAAVQFAKSNNLLGVLLNAKVLGEVPSLIQGIKEHGVILATFIPPGYSAPHLLKTGNGDVPTVDAVLQNGVLTYLNNGLGL